MEWKRKKPTVTINYNNKTLENSEYTVTYENNIDTGKATCNIQSNLFNGIIHKQFYIWPLGPSKVELNLNKDNSVKYSWTPSDSDINGYYARVYENYDAQNNSYDNYYDIKAYNSSLTNLSFPKKLESNKTYKIIFYSRKIYGKTTNDILTSTKSTRSEIILKPSNYNVDLNLEKSESVEGVPIKVSAINTTSAMEGITQYAYLYKKTTDSNWIIAKNYSSDTTYDMKILKAGTYDVLVKAKVLLSSGDQTNAIVVKGVKNNIEITSDVTKPTLKVSTSQSEWTNKNIEITIFAKDTESGLKSVKINDKEVELTEDKIVYSATQNDYYRIVATDNSGNVEGTLVTINKIDKTNPELEITSTPCIMTNKNVTLHIAAKDKESGLKSVTINGKSVAIENGEALYDIDINGIYTIVAIDKAGNVTYNVVPINNIDKIKPELTVTQEIIDWTNQSVSLSITAKDAEAGLKSVTINGESLTLENDEALYSVDINGTYNIMATDNAGNTEYKTLTISNIDKDKPKLTISGNPKNWTNQDIVLTITSSDVDSGVKKLTVNGTSLTLENGIAKYPITKNGSYKVLSIDKAGNEIIQLINVSKIDKIKPTCNIQKNDKILSILSEDQNSGLAENAYSWDNVTFSSFNSQTITESKNYNAYIKDNAGNIATCSLNVELAKIEPPTISINEPSSFSTKEKKIIIDVIKGTNELNNTNEYEYYLSTSLTQLTNGEFLKYESGKEFSIGTNKTGIYYLFVKSIKDINGVENTSASLATINGKKYYKYGPYIFDNTNPICEIKLNPKTWTNQVVTLNVEGTDETSNSENIFYSFNNDTYDYTNSMEVTSNGTYKAFIKDEVGNIGECVINVSTIEKNNPIINFSLSSSKTYQKSVETILTTSDLESGINTSSLKYEWTQSTIQPVISSFKTTYENNQKIIKNTGTGNNWYLWVLSSDNAGNTLIKKAGPFYLDNDLPTKPIISSNITSGEKVDSDVNLKLSGSKALSGISKYQYSFNNGVSWHDYNEETGITIEDEGTTNVVARSIIFVGISSEISDTFVIDIERKPLEVKLKKSTDNLTRENVTVYITSITKLHQIEGWILSEDGYTLSKEYKENTIEKIELKDINGNVTYQTINITNIDRISPKISLEYDNQDSSSLVKITSDEKLQELNGWTISTDEKTLKKVYYENTIEDIEVSDVAGNKTNITVNVNDIIEKYFDIYLSYQLLSGNKIKVTILSDTKLKSLKGWTISEDQTKLTKEYDKDIFENIEVSDVNGNIQTVYLMYNFPKEENLVATINYSKQEKTNEDIIVTIISNMILNPLEGWSLSEDKKSMTKIYTENSEEILEVNSISNKTVNLKISISNIDKEAPALVNYKNNGVYNSLKIQFTKPVKLVKVTRDGIDLNYIIDSDVEYTDPGDYIIEIIDEAGNVSKYNISLSTDIMNVESPNTGKTVKTIVILFGIINIIVGCLLVKKKYIF